MLFGYAVRTTLAFIEPMDSFAYCLLAHAVLFREPNPRRYFLSFHLNKAAMDYALSMVQFLLRPTRIEFMPENNG
jgi:hypothetical protein